MGTRKDNQNLGKVIAYDDFHGVYTLLVGRERTPMQFPLSALTR